MIVKNVHRGPNLVRKVQIVLAGTTRSPRRGYAKLADRTRPCAA